MALLYPFKGILPNREILSEVVSRPFDSYTMKQVESIIKQTPHSFLSIIKPELDAGKRTKPDNPEAQKKSRQKYLKFLENGHLLESEAEKFYIYRQIKPTFTYTGILATISTEDYHNGTIRIHEQTLQKKEEKLKDYLKIVGLNAEPVMFTYPHMHEMDELMNHLTSSAPYADFEMEGKHHQLWEVSEEKDIVQLQSIFSRIPSVYVADGHHRSASSVLLADELHQELDREEEHPSWSRFLGVFFPDHNLQLFEFNRLVKGLERFDIMEILHQLGEEFDVELVDEENFHPHAPYHFSMYAENRWYNLKLKAEAQSDDFGDKLDAILLTQRILKPLFGIEDLRNDERIGFSSGIKGAAELKRLVDKGDYQLAFGLFPVRMEQFFSFSDQGRIMPPKTTWFEPKLLNGLVVYDIYPDQR